MGPAVNKSYSDLDLDQLMPTVQILALYIFSAILAMDKLYM